MGGSTVYTIYLHLPLSNLPTPAEAKSYSNPGHTYELSSPASLQTGVWRPPHQQPSPQWLPPEAGECGTQSESLASPPDALELPE